jgi:hypothetical protein
MVFERLFAACRRDGQAGVTGSVACIKETLSSVLRSG